VAGWIWVSRLLRQVFSVGIIQPPM
jgi:hypothetical protein